MAYTPTKWQDHIPEVQDGTPVSAVNIDVYKRPAFRSSINSSMSRAHCSGTYRTSRRRSLPIQLLRGDIDIAIVPYGHAVVDIDCAEYVLVRQRSKGRII